MSTDRFEGIESGNAKRRKRAQTKAFLPLPLGQHYPRHYPTQPGASPCQPMPILGDAVRSLGSSFATHSEALGRPLNLRQVAALIGSSPWTVRQTLIPRGLPFFRFKANGRLVFFESQIVRWIENQQQGGQTTK